MTDSKLGTLETKLNKLLASNEISIPAEGWVRHIRQGLNMSIAEFAKLLNKDLVSVREFEIREKDQKIRLSLLKEIAELLNCRLIYVIVPKEGSFEQAITKRMKDLNGTKND